MAHRQRRSHGDGRRGGDGRRRMFTKLLKDKDAKIRNDSEAAKFLDGMRSYPNKVELIRLLDDVRDNGPIRIQEALSMIGDSTGALRILFPLLQEIMNDDTAAPLYAPLRNRLLLTIFLTPVLMDALAEWEFVDSLDAQEANLFCSFLVILAQSLPECRKSSAVERMARCLKANSDVRDSKKLCAILCLDAEEVHDPSSQTRSDGNSKRPGNSGPVCWVSDRIPPGGRHDNDEKNYRDIKLIPTLEELECERPAWLPLSSGENAVIHDEGQRILDAQFRLLREDAIFTIKENIKDSVRPWKNARIIGINYYNTSRRKGSKPRISFPSFIIQVDARKTKMDWARARVLPHSGIIALCRNGVPIRLGTITIREHEQSGQWLKSVGGPKFGVVFDDEDDFNVSLQEMAHNQSISNEFVKLGEEILAAEAKLDLSRQEILQLDAMKYRREILMSRLEVYDMIEASSSFFSYRPVLQVLQRMTEVPLSDELVYARAYGERPPYLPSKMKMPNTESFHGYVCDLDAWNIDDVVAQTSLDTSQANALRHALSSRVALIQGPPGCGKTFIGALIARMIRENTNESIVCVCYTNHALDQFLEHLLDHGEKRIVRIGGRSKSEKLSGFQLRELSRNKANLSNEASRRLKAVDSQLYRQHEGIEETVKELNQPLRWTSSDGGVGVSSYLEVEYPQLHKCLIVPSSTDGFKVVGPNNKDVEDDFLWNIWVKGMPLPEWIIPSMGSNLPKGLDEFWDLDLDERHERIEMWRSDMMAETRRHLYSQVKGFLQLDEEKRGILQQKDLAILKDARVIGATTSGAAQYRDILPQKSAGVVMVEEAGEVLEAHVLASLVEKSGQADETKHLILIGDHEQLRPKVESYKLQTVSRKGFDLDRSLFERLILSSGLESSMLEVQHRMRPEISNFIRMQTYPSLKDHPSVHNHPSVKGVDSDVVFIDHNVLEDGLRNSGRDDGYDKTKSNEHEAHVSVELVRFFLLQGYRQDQIVVLTPYVGQLLMIVRLMATKIKETTAYVSDLDMQDILDTMDSEQSESGDAVVEERKDRGNKSVRVSSVDNFQGEEADIIIISLVRSNKHGNIGFLKEPQRVNVLLSRARIGLFIVGNSKTLLASGKGSDVWRPLLNTMHDNSQLLQGLPTICEKHADDEPILLKNPEDYRTLPPPLRL